MIWPGSHRKCHAFLTTSKSGQRNGYGKAAAEKKNLSGGPDPNPTWAANMKEARDWCNENIVPVDCWGKSGSVVFYHSRLAHHASNNYSDNVSAPHPPLVIVLRFPLTQPPATLCTDPSSGPAALRPDAGVPPRRRGA